MNALDVLPSILDLGRHYQAISAAHDGIDAAEIAGDFEAAKIAAVADGLWLDRDTAIVELILTMPAVALADASVQLLAALEWVDGNYVDEWPQEAKELVKRVRRVLVSTALVTSRAAGIDPAMMGFSDLGSIHRGEFPPALLNSDEKATMAAPSPTDDPDAELIEVAADYAAAAKETRRLDASKDTPDEAYEPLDKRRWAARAQAAELPATTLFGLRAKALIYATEIDLGKPNRDQNSLGLLAESISRDILCNPLTGETVTLDTRGERVEEPPTASLDAELLVLCDQLTDVYGRWTAAVSGAAQHIDAPAQLTAAMDTADEAVWAIADRIEAIIPATPAGLQAKAGAAILVWSSGDGPDGIPDDSRLAAIARSILINLAGDTVAQPASSSIKETATPEGSDSGLLVLVAEFRALDTALMAFNGLEGLPEKLVNSTHEHWWEVAHKVREMPAITPEGLRAKCTVFDGVFRDCCDENGPVDEFAASLVRDIRAGAAEHSEAAQDSSRPWPDAELIRLCERLVEISNAERSLGRAIKDDDERETAAQPLHDEWLTIRARLYEIGRPVTLEGAIAMARAANASADHDTEYAVTASDLGDWLALGACAYLADTAAPEPTR
jgi:hypothetical protein